MSTRNKYLWLVVLGLAIVAVVAAMMASNHSSQTQKTQQAITQAKHLKLPGTKETTSNNVSTVQVSKVAGGYLTDLRGMALYVSGADPASVSKCDGTCAQNWPPYKPTDAVNLPAEWSIIKRSDGSQQYAYKLKPLYYYIGDTAPGDITGNQLNGFTAASP